MSLRKIFSSPKAMNIISKEKKEIRWLGLPTNSIQEAYTLESDKVRYWYLSERGGLNLGTVN
jgi:hypothetical protein